MPYRFKVDEPVEKGFRRIAREQLDLALVELAAPHIQPKGVHECRKAMKRLRALVRLAAPALGAEKAKRRNKALSSIAKLLADRRDQAVLLETVARLASDGGADAAFTIAPLRAHIAAHVGDQPKTLDDASASEARRLLLKESKKFSRMRFRGRSFDALAGGLEDSYRQARKWIKHAYEEPSDETFHNLRKAVQWHWRQMSLLGRAWPDEFAVRVTAARELSQLLGEDHDLAMLVHATASADDIASEHKEAIVALCLRRQQALRDAAEFRAARLFAETPRAFSKRIAAYWRYGRIRDPRANALARDAAVEHQKHPTPGVKETFHSQDAGFAPTKPKLASKTGTSAPSQRRA